jgi:hypothetical protein
VNHPKEVSGSDRVVALVAGTIFLLGALGTTWLVGFRSPRQLLAAILALYLFTWLVALVVGRSSQRELLLRFTLVTLVISATLGALEIPALLGLLDFRNVFVDVRRTPWRARSNLFDEELLWKRKPYVVLSGTRRGDISEIWCLPGSRAWSYSYDLRYDGNGFRNDEDLDSANIAVIGNSFIEGVETPYEQTLVRQLAGLSGKSVVNLGISGYGPGQQLVVLRRLALPLQPEVIVWSFHEGTDLREIGPHDLAGSAGMYKLTGSASDRSFAKNVMHWLFDTLDRCEPSEKAENRIGAFRSADGAEIPMYFLVPPRPLERRDLAALEQLSDLLTQANDLAAGNGARLIVMYIPTKYRVYGDFVELPPASDLRGSVLSDLPARLKQLASRVSPDLGFLDLTPLFRSAAAEGAVLYLSDDTHWNPEGQYLAAKALMDVIRSADARPLPASSD